MIPSVMYPFIRQGESGATKEERAIFRDVRCLKLALYKCIFSPSLKTYNVPYCLGWAVVVIFFKHHQNKQYTTPDHISTNRIEMQQHTRS